MARHRGVRDMDFDEEYDRYYSCYGHSVEEDSCISPGTGSQFLYDRNSKVPTISSFMGEPVAEEEYSSEDSFNVSHNEVPANNQQNLNPLDLAKIQSCVEGMQDVVGDTIPESVLRKAAFDYNSDLEKALDAVLKSSDSSKRERSNVKSEFPLQRPDFKNKNSSRANVILEKNNVTSSCEAVPENKEPSPENLPVEKDNPPVEKENPPVENDNPPAEKSLTHSEDTSQVKKNTADNILKLYKKERDAEKPLLNLVVVGHVDAGKSTLMGHLLFKLGCVPKKTMHKYEQDSKKIGKASFMYAWVLDETTEERNRGITMDIAQSKFETPHRTVNLLDAPGHKDFIPNMITGAAQAEVAVLVVDATKGEFETGFEAGGQTCEHTMLIRSLGVSQLAIAINKMDNVKWEKERYDEIVSKLKAFLKKAGFKESDVQFVPCSGLTGENLTIPPVDPDVKKWYQGPTLVEVIDSFKPPERPLTRPLRVSINDAFKGMGSGICISGRIESGMIRNGDKVLLMPSGELVSVKGVTIDSAAFQNAYAGDSVVLQLVGVDINNVSSGNILCDISNPIKVTNHFEARLVVFNISVPITKGFLVVLHYQSLSEQATITKLVSQLHRVTGELVKKRPRCLSKHSSAVVEIQVSKPICLELYKDYKDLGRFMLRSGGSTIAAGVVTAIY